VQDEQGFVGSIGAGVVEEEVAQHDFVVELAQRVGETSAA